MGKIKFQSKIADCLKPKDMMQKQRVKQRQKFRRRSFMNAIRRFLMSDSFMYGPLATKHYRAPGVRYISGEEREKASKSPKGILKEVLATPGETLKGSDPILQIIDQLDQTSEASGQVVQGTYVSVHKTVTTTTVAVDDEKGDVRSGVTGALLHDQAAPRSIDIRGDTELTEPEGDEEQFWPHEEPEDGRTPLDQSVAEKVANQLIAVLGGRFSDDLGINVDVSDAEVECWFLAANLFSRGVALDVSKNTYKELQAAGVSNMADLLTLEETALAAILEKTGYTKYGSRVASNLQKLATALEENYWSRISTFKHSSDNHELIRQLRSLPGVKLSTARTFLRELQGLWKGATPEFDMRIKRAGLHLKLLGSIKPPPSPERVLSDFARESGIDIRDLEVALYKLGAEHERQYGECPGGADCRVLLRSEQVMASIPSDIFL